MIKPDFIENRMVMVVMLAMGGLYYANLLTVTAPNPNVHSHYTQFVKVKSKRATSFVGFYIIYTL
jgi:hypothetical protein